MRIAALFSLTAALMAGCSTFPEVNASVASTQADAPYPELVPIGTLKARMTDTNLTPEMAPNLESRADRLRRRAAALQRRNVVDDETRARMKEGVTQ